MSSTYHPYAPVQERGSMRAFLLALVMHLLLGLVLYFGVQWQIRSPAGAEAEIWVDLPDVTPTPTPPPPRPVEQPQPQPPKIEPKVEEKADIALREQKRKQEEAARQAEQHRREEARRAEQEKQDKLEAARKQREREVEQREAELRKQKAAEQQAKQREERLKAEKAEKAEKAAKEKVERERLAKEKAEKDKLAKEKAERDAKAKEAAAQARQSELARLRALAGGGTSVGGSGGGQGEGTGSDTKASPGYADRVRTRVKPNIVFDPDAVSGNPSAIVAVRLAPDGSILSKRLARSSGDSAWDNAVLRAVERSDPLPRDTNGKAPSSFNITFRPKD